MRLPPFDALVAFEAVARSKRMTAAAAELAITQSAVSHRIRRLEDFMGAPLFRRGAEVSLTPAGKALLEGLVRPLEDLAGLKARCLSTLEPERLRMGVGDAFAHNWLMRRLPALTSDAGVVIDLALVEAEHVAGVGDFDLRMTCVPAAELRNTSTQAALPREMVFPVCRPDLLPPDFQLGDAEVLSQLPLLHKGARNRTSDEWSWPLWLERLGLPPQPRESFRFASIGAAMAAAFEGGGVVLTRTLLAHDALKDGRLVRVLAPEFDQPCSKGCLLRWPAALREDQRVRAVVAHLVDEAEKSCAAPV